MSSRITSYRVVLPHPWIRIPVGRGTEERVRQLVEERAGSLPKDVPPDQVGPWKRQLQQRLVTDIKRAKEYGGIDFYLPAGRMHDLLVGASFVVSQVSPPGQLPEDMSPDQAVGAVLADLIQGSPGAAPVSVAGQAWVRRHRIVQPDQDKAAGVDVPMTSVSYVTALPDDHTRWVLVEFSGTGDGDPDSESTAVVVELFDAIMGTWRWITEDDDTWAESTADVG